jgi:Protein-disulfide isomerase
MNRRILFQSSVAILASVMTAGILVGCAPEREDQAKAASEGNTLVRAHSPVIGPKDAPVTIVEFLDPSCEGCRAFYPFVKQILAKYPNEVRLVIRYVPFHSGSEMAIGILEAARMQGIYEPVLQAVFESQPQWHDDLELKAAWAAAESAGLDVKKAREQLAFPEVAANLKTDVGDANAHRVAQTPTFFVNGKPVEPFGPKQLNMLVQSEVERSRGIEG